MSFCKLTISKTISIIILWSAITAIAQEKQVHLNSLRYGSTPKYSRLVFDISASFSYKVIPLTNPPRIAIDLNNVKLLKAPSQPPLTHDLFNKIRHASQNNKLRVVIDLKFKNTPKYFTLKPNKQHGHRLVLDFFPTSITNSKIAPNKKHSDTHYSYVDFVKFWGGIPRIRIENSLNYSWQTIEKALTQQSIEIIERNIPSSTFLIRYDMENSFFSSNKTLLIKLVAKQDLTEVSVLNTNNRPAAPKVSFSLLELLYPTIKTLVMVNNISPVREPIPLVKKHTLSQ